MITFRTKKIVLQANDLRERYIALSRKNFMFKRAYGNNISLT